MNKPPNLDDIFSNEFLKEFEEREQEKTLLNRDEQLIAIKKREKLKPIRDFLQKFVELEIKVRHSDKYGKQFIHNNSLVDEQLFSFYEQDSSNSWAPGISVCFDHPAIVEIAVPNKPEDGEIVIKVASNHPDAFLLERNFFGIEAACAALAKFIGRNTSSIGKRPGKKHKTSHNLTQNFDNVPNEPPKNELNNNINKSLAQETKEVKELREFKELKGLMQKNSEKKETE